MTRKTLVRTLILTLCAIVLMSSEVAETRESPTVHNGEAHTHASDYVQHGRQHFAVGDYAGAIADFDKALQINPESPAAYYHRATAKFEWGKSEQGTGNTEHAKRLYHAAIEDYTQVTTLDPENPGAYIFGGTVHLRLADLERTVGNAQQARHHFQAAHEMGRQLTELDPGNASGWQTRGVANHRLGILAADSGDREQAQRHYEAGIEAYNQAVAFRPENPAVYAARGAVHISLGLLEMVRNTIEQAQFHYQAAIADHKQAVHLSPPEYATFFSGGLSWARVRLGESEVALGNIPAAQHQYRSAIGGFNEAIGIGPGESLVGIAPRDVFTALAYNDRAEAKLRLGESEGLLGNVQQAEQYYRETIADCDQGLASGMGTVRVLYTRGRAKAALSDHTGAIADFNSVLRIRSNYALAYYARGLAKQARGESDTEDDIALNLGDLADLLEQNVGEILEQDVTVEIEQDGHRVSAQDTSAAADFQKAKALNPDVEQLYPFSVGGEE